MRRLSSLVLVLTVVLAAGCGSSESNRETTNDDVPSAEGDSLLPEVGDLRWAVMSFFDDGITIETDVWRLGEDGNAPASSTVTLPYAGQVGAFNSTGSLFAMWYSDYEVGPGLAVAHGEDYSTLGEVISGGFVWHPSQPSLAYISVDMTTGSSYLMQADVSTDTEVSFETTRVAEVPIETMLWAWGDWGYLVEGDHLTPMGGDEYGRQRATYLLDANGLPVVGAPVQPTAYPSPSGVLLVKNGITGGYVSPDPGLQFDIDLIDLRFDGLLAVDTSFNPVDADEDGWDFVNSFASSYDTFYVVSDSGQHVIVLDLTDTGSATHPVHVVDLPTGNIYTWDLDELGSISMAFAADDRFVVYATSAGHFRFLDWRTGQEYSIDGAVKENPRETGSVASAVLTVIHAP